MSSYDMSTKGVLAAGTARFAGVILSIVAVFEILQGISAIANDNVFVRGVSYTYELDITAWGWIHLLMGVAGLAIGIAIITEHTVGYLGGIAVAFVGAVANFAFLPYNPLWALLLISFNVLVIWALCTQLAGDRVDASYYDDHDVVPPSPGPLGSGEPAAPRHATPGAPPSVPR